MYTVVSNSSKSKNRKAYISGTIKDGMVNFNRSEFLYLMPSLEISGQPETIKKHAPLKNLENH